VQLGEEGKPKRASLPKDWTVENVDLERACRLLSLPRLVGDHPETGKPIEANIGRYGPTSAMTAPTPTSRRSTKCSTSA
jgi:DNA topoisomerase I (EC 5.99.1.2)